MTRRRLTSQRSSGRRGEQAAPTRQLSLFDSTCILVGIIIGAGIFETAPTVAASCPGAAAVLGIWLVGGLLALAGALCYAELATAYPREGGDYVYLGRAYGPWAGFLERPTTTGGVLNRGTNMFVRMIGHALAFSSVVSSTVPIIYHGGNAWRDHSPEVGGHQVAGRTMLALAPGFFIGLSNMRRRLEYV